MWVWGSDMGTYMDYMEKYMNLRDYIDCIGHFIKYEVHIDHKQCHSAHSQFRERNQYCRAGPFSNKTLRPYEGCFKLTFSKYFLHIQTKCNICTYGTSCYNEIQSVRPTLISITEKALL